MGAIFDKISPSCFITQSNCRFELFPLVKLALTYMGVLISVTYEHPVCSSAQSNPTAVIWSRQGVCDELVCTVLQSALHCTALLFTASLCRGAVHAPDGRHLPRDSCLHHPGSYWWIQQITRRGVVPKGGNVKP